MRRSQSKLFPGPGVGGWEINLFVGERGGGSGYNFGTCNFTI